jgi:hypothetical protein
MTPVPAAGAAASAMVRGRSAVGVLLLCRCPAVRRGRLDRRVRRGVPPGVAWPDRPQAAWLLAAFADPHLGFDASSGRPHDGLSATRARTPGPPAGMPSERSTSMTQASAMNAGLLTEWINHRPGPAGSGRCRRRVDEHVGGPRFAFYGRMSTKEFQDQGSSLSWQRESARDLIAGRGVIVAEFFDVGCSRAGPGPPVHKPPACSRHSPPMIAPSMRSSSASTNGAIDLGNPTHQAIVVLLGAQSQR